MSPGDSLREELIEALNSARVNIPFATFAVRPLSFMAYLP
jgi:hypothetical protein